MWDRNRKEVDVPAERACADCYFTYIKLSHFVICVLCQRLFKSRHFFGSLLRDSFNCWLAVGGKVKKSKRLHIISVASVFDFLVCTPNIMWCLYWLSILYQIYRILIAFCFVVLSTFLDLCQMWSCRPHPCGPLGPRSSYPGAVRAADTRDPPIYYWSVVNSSGDISVHLSFAFVYTSRFCSLKRCPWHTFWTMRPTLTIIYFWIY